MPSSMEIPAGVMDCLPAYYRIDARQYTDGEAFDYTRRIARGHYENFTVVSWALPAALRQHMFNVYAYCRWADDLGDELGDRDRSLEALAWWRRELVRCYAGEASHPVFVALRDTIRRFDIPPDPFHRLIDAFAQDQRICRYETFEELLEYCRSSADPVGRLVLYLFEIRDPERQTWSDRICTALQLTNFWQDVTRDLEKGRIYIPGQDLRRFGVSENAILERRFGTEFRELMRFEVARTRELFLEGRPLVEAVPHRLALDVSLFIEGGEAILDLIEKQGFDTLSRRPALGTGGKLRLMARRLFGLRRPA